jgi:hypothetical protein
LISSCANDAAVVKEPRKGSTEYALSRGKTMFLWTTAPLRLEIPGVMRTHTWIPRRLETIKSGSGTRCQLKSINFNKRAISL